MRKQVESDLARNFRIVASDMRGHGGSDVDEALKKVSIPKLVIHGKQDRIIRDQASEHYARTIAGASLSVYEGAGHMSFWEEADRFNADLASFARQHAKP